MMHIKKHYIIFIVPLLFGTILGLIQGCGTGNLNSTTQIPDSTGLRNKNPFPVSMKTFETRLQQRIAAGDSFPVKPAFLRSCLPENSEGFEISGEDSMYSFTSELKLSEFYRRLTSKNESTLEIRITDLIQRKNLVESEINLFNSGLSEFEDAEQKFHAPPDSSTLFWTWEKPAEFLHGLSAIVDFRFRISIIAEGNRTEKIPEKLFGLINREILLHPPVSKPKAETKKTDTLPKKRKKK